MAIASDPAPVSLGTPPRHVSRLLRLRLLCGGAGGTIAWTLLAIAIPVSAILLPRTDWSALTFPDRPAITEGRLTQTRSTHARENDRQVIALEYEYAVDGVDRTGVSYVTGSAPHAAGEIVAIEYDPDQPERSRVRGARRAHFDLWAAPFALLPLVGLVLAGIGAVRGARVIRLLRSGRPARGRLVARRATKLYINEDNIVELTFEFATDDGTAARAVVRSHRPAPLEDDAEEPLLYDPRCPSRATLLDHLPGSPRIDEQGRLHARMEPRTLVPLLLAGAVAGEIAVIGLLLLLL